MMMMMMMMMMMTMMMMMAVVLVVVVQSHRSRAGPAAAARDQRQLRRLWPPRGCSSKRRVKSGTVFRSVAHHSDRKTGAVLCKSNSKTSLIFLSKKRQ